MSYYLGWSAAIIAYFALLFGCYQYGLQSGYSYGFKDGEEWWWKMAHEVEAEREQMWREELRKS